MKWGAKLCGILGGVLWLGHGLWQAEPVSIAWSLPAVVSIVGGIISKRRPFDGGILERIPVRFEHSLHGERSFCILVG
jgi:hypothetical protein